MCRTVKLISQRPPSLPVREERNRSFTCTACSWVESSRVIAGKAKHQVDEWKKLVRGSFAKISTAIIISLILREKYHESVINKNNDNTIKCGFYSCGCCCWRFCNQASIHRVSEHLTRKLRFCQAKPASAPNRGEWPEFLRLHENLHKNTATQCSLQRFIVDIDLECTKYNKTDRGQDRKSVV